MRNSSVHEYDDDFKKESIELAKSLGNFSKAAKEKGIHVNTLRKWVKQEEKENSLLKSQSSVDDNSTLNTNSSMSNQGIEEVGDTHTSYADVEMTQLQEYKNHYHMVQNELENERKMNEQLRKELSKAQSLIGKLYMESNRSL